MAKSKLISKAADVVEYRPKPSLSVDAKDLPAIKDWKVGKTYRMMVTAKMVSMSEDDEYSDYDDGRPKTARARFRITKISEK